MGESLRQSFKRTAIVALVGEAHSTRAWGRLLSSPFHYSPASSRCAGQGLGSPVVLPCSSLSMSRTSTQNSAGEGRYRRKVGFEAFEAGPDALFAFTCQAKSEGYKRSRNTRVFAVAVSPDESGESALDWLMTEVVEDGDEVVAIRVIELGEGGGSYSCSAGGRGSRRC